MNDFNVGDRVRLAPTTPNLRLHNQVGESIGTIVRESTFKSWVVSWPYRQAGHSTATADVHAHEIEKVTDV